MTGDDNNSDDSSKTQPPTPIRRSKRVRAPAKKMPETPVMKKRARKSTSAQRGMKEQQQTQDSLKALAKRERLKPKPTRKYQKRQKKRDGIVKGAPSLAKDAHVDDDGSESMDEDEMFCCICQCTVDFSDKDQFHWPEEIDSDSDEDADENSEHENDNQQDEGDGDGDAVMGKELKYSNNSQLPSASASGKNSKQNSVNTSKSKNSSCSSGSEDFYGVKLPNSLYDPNNALMICDGCNRCYHQRCHFTPVLSIPKRDWFCLICEQKDQLNVSAQNKNKESKSKSKSKSKRGRPKKSDIPTNHEDCAVASKCASHEESNLELSKTTPLTMQELDKIYRPSGKIGTTYSSGSSVIVSHSGVPGFVQNVPSPPNGRGGAHASKEMTAKITSTLEERFEFHTSHLKAGIIRKGSQQVVKLIDQNLSSMRLCQNSIRTLTETNNRARKALIVKYNRTHQLPQELVQITTRLAGLKLKLRNLFHTLQYVVQNKDDRKELFDWFSRVKSEGRFTPAKICDTKIIRKNNQPVPTIISLDGSPKEQLGPKSGEQIDVALLESKLFVGGVVRHEPRFDIKDYDADEDNDSESDDPTNTIRCCVCFSGHVEDDNDVIMCDGLKCFRAMHMKCCEPQVTQQMLDDDEDGVWFCPFCVCTAKTMHYAHTEYFEPDDDVSVKSWEIAEHVFPEAESQLKAAQKWKIGKRNDNSDQVLAALLGIEIAEEHNSNAKKEIEGNDDDDDEGDDSFGSEHVSKSSASAGSSKGSSQSGVNWDVKSELSALSCSESESGSESEGNENAAKPRRSRRKRMVDCSSGADSQSGSLRRVSDVGKLDTSNIVRGKRNRGGVDYAR